GGARSGSPRVSAAPGLPPAWTRRIFGHARTALGPSRARAAARASLLDPRGVGGRGPGGGAARRGHPSPLARAVDREEYGAADGRTDRQRAAGPARDAPVLPGGPPRTRRAGFGRGAPAFLHRAGDGALAQLLPRARGAGDPGDPRQRPYLGPLLP